MLDTQTQIIGAGFEQPDFSKGGLLVEPAESGVLNVCLCDQHPSDVVLSDRQFGNWRLCKTHDGAVKLESMNGMSVMLYAADSKGDCMPIRCSEQAATEAKGVCPDCDDTGKMADCNWQDYTICHCKAGKALKT